MKFKSVILEVRNTDLFTLEIMEEISVPSLVKDLENLLLAEKSAVQLHKTEPDYVLDISVQRNQDDPLVAAACSNFTIRLMSRNRLTPVSTISGHKDTITKVQFGKTDSHLVFSCSKDKTVRCWDTRASTSKEMQMYKTPPSVEADVFCLDISHSDRLLCAGTEQVKGDAYILFWDSRQNSLLGCYSESHQDDVTQVVFQPGSDQYLASGSADGLVCTFDLNETTEDDALQTTSNAESDVGRIGWCGKGGKDCVYCVTSDNTFHVWDALEGDPFCTVDNFDSLGKDASSVEYIVDCIPELTACEDKSSAILVTGSHSGCLRLVSCTENGMSVLSTLPDGHSATVRCSQWDSKTKTLLTGGEDSLMCLWSTETSKQFSSRDSKVKTKGKIKGKASVSDNTAKPYAKKRR